MRVYDASCYVTLPDLQPQSVKVPNVGNGGALGHLTLPFTGDSRMV